MRSASANDARANQPSKRLGQHFLVDPRHLKRFVHLIHCEPDALCLEIGPGTGNITVELAPRVTALHAVELDARRLAALRERVAAWPHVNVAHADILRYEPPERPLVVVGAIPYQITSPLMERLVMWKPRLRRAYLIIQREVAQRLAAVPGTKSWGRITCLAQYHFEVRRRWDIAPAAFHPRPRVHSSVVELVSRPRPPCEVEDEALFFALIAQLFQHRRKTLWNALRSWGDLQLTETCLRDLLAVGHLAPTIRGETLSLIALARLANLLKKTSQRIES